MEGIPDDIEDRIRKAREFNSKSCGRHVTCEIFGEPEPEWAKKRFTPKTEKALSRTRIYQQRYQLDRRIAEAKRKQVAHAGTYGIVRDVFSEKNRVRFRVFVGYVKVFDCPIDAAEFRNSVMRHKYPDVPEFQIDLDAVWRKWGCNCGKHRRPD